MLCGMKMDAESFKKSIHPFLKENGFKKSNATWRRAQEESIAVFNVQKSPWGGGVYYINLGVYFRRLGNEEAPTENRCHVQVRLDLDTPANVISEAMAWFQARTTFNGAVALVEEDSKKGLVYKELRSSAAT